MKEWQERVAAFNDARKWSEPEKVKDLLLNLHKEISRLSDIIKWVPEVAVQQRLLLKHKDDVENILGDMSYTVLTIGHLTNIDVERALDQRLARYEEKFPLKESRGKHTNVEAGGVDKDKKN